MLLTYIYIEMVDMPCVLGSCGCWCGV